MKGAHEGRLAGVGPYCNWQYKPRLNFGNDPNRGHYSRFQFWGIVYSEAGSKLPQNVRIQIRNPRAYYLSKRDQHWHSLQKDVTVDGLHYPEDFNGGAVKADTRLEGDGSRSITMIEHYNYHFWPASPEIQKVKIDPNDVAGIFTNFQARLIPDHSGENPDFSQVRFMAQSGGDYWVYPPTGKGNPTENDDAGMGKFKFLTPDWQYFNMHTLTEEEIRKNPPPLN
jgi:hypothetical protein